MLKKSALALAVIVIGFFGATAIASPASAGRPSYCPNIVDYLCWSDNPANHAAAHYYIVDTWDFNDGYCYNVGGWWDNQIRSMYFNSPNEDRHVTHYSSLNCSGVIVTTVSGLIEQDKEHSCNQIAAIWNGSCYPATISSFMIWNS